jgi:TonB family protein
MNSILHRGIFLVPLVFIAILCSAHAQSSTDNRTDSTKSVVPAKGSEEIEPEPGEFVQVDVDPGFDQQEFGQRIRYPEEARRKNIEGKVVVRVLIDKTGRPVRSLIDMSDNELLTEAARNVVMATRFTPAMQNGKPVPVWISIPITFKLK